MAKIDPKMTPGDTMLNMSAKDAKYGFGRLIDLARSAPVVVEKHGRPVVVVMAVEEFDRLKGLEATQSSYEPQPETKNEINEG